MKRLLEFVKESPIKEKPSHPITCPYCSSVKIKSTGKETTLIGGGSGVDDDPNHTWEHCACESCGKEFVRETKDGNVWYTDSREKGRVLRGMPSCFETYIYTCKKCGGEVRRRYKEPNSEKDPGCLIMTGDGVPQYRTFYECKDCGKSIRTPDDYWYPKPKRKLWHIIRSWWRRKVWWKIFGEPKISWTIWEEPGICVINDYAVAKVNVSGPLEP